MEVTEKAKCWRFLKMSILPLCLLVWLSYKACIALDNTVQLKERLADNAKAKDSSPLNLRTKALNYFSTTSSPFT